MKAFIFRGDLYLRCVPAKSLFHSTMVHEAVNRGDIFALRVSDQKLTIIPGLSVVEHCNFEGGTVKAPESLLVKKMKADAKSALVGWQAALKKLNSDLREMTSGKN